VQSNETLQEMKKISKPISLQIRKSNLPWEVHLLNTKHRKCVHEKSEAKQYPPKMITSKTAIGINFQLSLSALSRS